MVQHAGKVLTHQFLIRQVWGGSVDVQNLRVLVRQVRQKIDPDPERPRTYLHGDRGRLPTAGPRLMLVQITNTSPSSTTRFEGSR